MKVCFVIIGLRTGGAEMMLVKLLQHLDRTRFDPVVISLTTMGDYGPRLSGMNIPVHALGLRPSLSAVLTLMKLSVLLREIRPDVVSTWMYHADLLGGIAARLAGIRAVVWNVRHSDLSPTRNKTRTLALVRICATLSRLVPERILTCSERARAVHADVGFHAAKLELIPNGFNLDEYFPNAAHRDDVRRELGVPPETPLVGFVARYDPQKNHIGFIEAAQEVRRRLPDVHFVMVGSEVDEQNAALHAAVRGAHLQAHVHMLGRRDDVARLMPAFDVLASSSMGEAFPNVLGEAMACGVPCVVTDVGDSAAIVGDTGRVVAAGDMKALARELSALLSLSASERAALGQLARERVRSHFDINGVVRRYEKTFSEVATVRCDARRRPA